MPTVGELLAQIRNGRMNAESSGDSPYGGINPGTDSPISQPGLDDISVETRASIGDYLSQKTKGLDRLEEQNKYPIEPDLSNIRLTDSSTGRPAPLTSVNDPQQSFIDSTPDNPEDLQLRDGFEMLKRLGFFDDLAGESGPEYDKNAQTDGHTLLNRQDVREKISGVLASNRFSAVSKPDDPFSTALVEEVGGTEFIDADGVRKDHPQIEKIKEIAQFVMNTGKRPMEAYPDAKLVPATDPDSLASPFGASSNLQYGEINPDTGIDPTSGTPDSSDPSESSSGSPGTPSPSSPGSSPGGTSSGVVNTPDFPYGVDHNAIQAEIQAAGLELAFELLDPALDLLNGLTGLFGFNGIYTNRPENPMSLVPGARFGFGQFPNPTAVDFETGELAELATLPLANAGYKFIRSLGLPIPKFSLSATGEANDLVKRMVKIGLTTVKEQMTSDPTSMSFWKGFIRKLKRMMTPENNYGLPVIPSSPIYQLPDNTKFIQALKDCPAMQFIRSMIVIGESVAASSVSGGSTLTPQPYRFSGVRDLNRMTNSAANRHAAGRFDSLRGANSVRNIPSLLLLPSAFSAGRAQYTGGSGVSVALSNNLNTNANFASLLSTAGPSLPVPTPANALTKKIGTPVAGGTAGMGASSNRFSREEVEAIENMLEAEHVPFYFHDLRTNEIVSFHAFLNTLSDSFSPQYNASSGFGRIEDVQIYSKTQRQIQVDFTLMSYNKDDMKEMYFKMNKLIAMVYPQFSRGTMLEHKGATGTTRFVQPFSQVTTATPVIRLRVGDIVKSNYSREAVARLMGVADPNFVILDPTEPTFSTGNCDEVVNEIITRTSRVPLDTAGQWDGTGWPIGSTVILDPPYDPLVAFDPETSTASSDRTATITQGNIGVKILEYIPFANPLGGTSPNQEEIIIRCQLVPSAPPSYFPANDRIATDNATDTPITEAMLSYRDINTELSAMLFCDGINTGLFDDLTYEPPVMTDDGIPNTGEIDDMRKRLFGDKNPIMRSFETTAGRGLAGVITSLNFDWGLNDTINWDTKNFGYKAPKGCKISISFTPIHDIAPGLDSDGMIRAPVFNVAGSSPHTHEDVHPEGMSDRVNTYNSTMSQYLEDN